MKIGNWDIKFLPRSEFYWKLRTVPGETVDFHFWGWWVFARERGA